MSSLTKKNIDTSLKFVYSDNNSLSVIFHDNELLIGVVGEFNKNLKELEKIDRALEKKAVDKKENKGLTNNTSLLPGLNNVSKVASKLADMQSVFDRFQY